MDEILPKKPCHHDSPVNTNQKMVSHGVNVVQEFVHPQYHPARVSTTVSKWCKIDFVRLQYYWSVFRLNHLEGTRRGPIQYPILTKKKGADKKKCGLFLRRFPNRYLFLKDTSKSTTRFEISCWTWLVGGARLGVSDRDFWLASENSGLGMETCPR